jgi:hypothetical protein
LTIEAMVKNLWKRIRMASSGKLARTFAAALGLPEAVATTVMKALRAEKDMVSMKGRGTSAAEMTKKDAAVLLTAIASGAVTSQLAEVTNFLLGMPQVLEKIDGEPPKGLESLRVSPGSFFYSSGTTTLLDGLLALLDEAWRLDEEFDEHDNAFRRPTFDSLSRPESLSFMLGMDGMKSGGFAIIKARVTRNLTVTRFYSSWPIKRDMKPDDDALGMFNSGAAFLSIVLLNGEVIAAAVKSLREPITKTRFRTKRIARAGRR